MDAMVRSLRGSFFAPCAEKSHSKETHGGDMKREQKRGAAQSLPPSRPVFAAGEAKRPSASRPPSAPLGLAPSLGGPA